MLYTLTGRINSSFDMDPNPQEHVDTDWQQTIPVMNSHKRHGADLLHVVGTMLVEILTFATSRTNRLVLFHENTTVVGKRRRELYQVKIMSHDKQMPRERKPRWTLNVNSSMLSRQTCFGKLVQIRKDQIWFADLSTKVITVRPQTQAALYVT